ncbi:transcriptional regulator [Paraburkholderia sp. SARCC-3016]|uniref:PhaM family polyhydroxyalkanoate granule multifunctional regulatory protein n=1 Tax=Paraburkholderia sp. SARCC-3016 TaxID=3058611 RepID=UPI002808B851|nr:PhaM family polyhydroxyalkanoate granule multifunctional regulatory protein [Paraburkholderia sp. SARCC-3016]MDQ7980226.1 transcriptional regulator [Paraburkholderia sp. SARCC-3016]
MTDTPGSTPPFPGFPGFPPAEMLDRMWGMMRLTPFGAAFPGTQPGAAQGFVPSLSMMSDMMAPLTNVEELDKRITDMRAVEQWLKLNLNMLQSAIQALEVQRATLATLRAFGAFAQQSMTQPVADAPPRETSTRERAEEERAAAGSRAGWREDEAAATGQSAQEAGQASGESVPPPGFDASGWWNLLQSQFNQIAQFAMAQPGMAAGAAAGEGNESGDREAGADAAAGADRASHGRPEHGAGAEAGATGARVRQPDAKRPAARRAPAGKTAKEGKGTGAVASRKTPNQPE